MLCFWYALHIHIAYVTTAVGCMSGCKRVVYYNKHFPVGWMKKKSNRFFLAIVSQHPAARIPEHLVNCSHFSADQLQIFRSKFATLDSVDGGTHGSSLC